MADRGLGGLLRLVEQEGIHLCYTDLSDAPGRRVYGLYYREPRRNLPVIILDHRLEHNLPLHRSVLAEELGHHFTAPSTSVAVAYTSYSVALALSRDERRALRWACDYLLPVAEVAAAVERGIATPWDLAEHFLVTEWLIWRRLEFMAAAAKSCIRKGVRLACFWGLATTAAVTLLGRFALA